MKRIHKAYWEGLRLLAAWERWNRKLPHNRLLRRWERESETTTRTTGPNASRRRARWRGPSDGDAATSKRTSTRVFAVFACCPPGPPDPVKRHSSSSSAITQDPLTRNRSVAMKTRE